MKRLLCSIPSIFLLVSCASGTTTTTQPKETTSTEATTTISTTTESIGNPVVSILLSNEKTITCELYPDIAPITVANFLSLVDSKYYENTLFHRIIPNFMIQTGGYYLEDRYVYPKATVPSIKGEFEVNGVENNLLHEPGVLSMARATAYDSGSSQFFICVETCSWLDKNYAAFGKTIDEESLNVAIELSKVQTCNIGGGLTDFPVEPISIVSITRVTKE